MAGKGKRRSVVAYVAELDIDQSLDGLSCQVKALMREKKKGEFWDAWLEPSYDLDEGVRVRIQAERFETQEELTKRKESEERVLAFQKEKESRLEQLEREDYERLKRKFEGR